jgi:hypothetical protein
MAQLQRRLTDEKGIGEEIICDFLHGIPPASRLIPFLLVPNGNLGASTAQIGTVASALRYLAKEVIMGAAPRFGSRGDLADLRARLVKGGVGEPLIADFLADVPGVSKATVWQHLAILKASGDYALIIEVLSDTAATPRHRSARDIRARLMRRSIRRPHPAACRACAPAREWCLRIRSACVSTC